MKVRSIYLSALGLLAGILLVFPLSLLAQGTWNQIETPNAPSARFGHSTVALADGRVVMFGGEDAESVNNDIFVFQNNDWNSVTPTGTAPSPRSNQSMVRLSDGSVYVFGGESEGGVNNDLFRYIYEINEWNPVTQPIHRPGGRELHSAHAYGDKMFMAGGTDGTDFFIGCWLYDPLLNTWEMETAAPVHICGAATAIEKDNFWILFVVEEGVINFNFKTGEWTTPKKPSMIPSSEIFKETYTFTQQPEPRQYSSFAHKGSKIWIFGGEDKESRVLNDTWEFDFETETMTQLVDMPVGLKSAAAAMYGGQVLIFGGQKADGTLSGDTYLFTPPSTNVNEGERMPEGFTLHQNYPNPFNPETTIAFDVKNPGRVVLKVFDLRGCEVATLIDAFKQMGRYAVPFDASGLASGIYFYQLRTKEFTDVKKMVLLE